MQTNRSNTTRKMRTTGLILLLLTGRRRQHRFRVDVDGVAVWFPLASFNALVKLVVARFRSDSGLAPLDRLTIHRLRKDLGKRGKELIVIGSREEYRLTISKAKAAGHHAVLLRAGGPALYYRRGCRGIAKALPLLYSGGRRGGISGPCQETARKRQRNKAETTRKLTLRCGSIKISFK
jgi:hypothetical protein